jgi:hypothetical protein
MAESHDRSLPWSLQQRRALVFIFAGVVVYLSYLLIRDRQYVPDPMPAESPLASALADRVDPNVADVVTLTALPNLGEKAATAIVEYRERGAVAFKSGADLLKVRGIGVATVNNLRPYLLFPNPTTQPSP